MEFYNLGIIVLVILIIIVGYFFFRHKAIKRKEREQAEYNVLKNNYPHGVEMFEKKYPYSSFSEIIRGKIEIQKLEEDYKKEQERKRERKEYWDLKNAYPHGIEMFEKKHPKCLRSEIINCKTEIQQLEQDYKKEKREQKEYDDLKNEYPHGVEAFEKQHPDYSRSEIINNKTNIQQLELNYIKEKEEEKERQLQNTKNKFIENVKGWECLLGNFHYTWLLYYYPTTCDFEATEQEWQNRRTVWNFKNNKDSITASKHQDALHRVILQIRRKLFTVSEARRLPFLTLVCLPASTKAKNEARYKEFSDRLCAETGMENGYGHIHYQKDGMSKNDPQNSTGKSILPIITFDDEWFSGRYVLLFDDVVTKGDTMLRYKRLMERMGAIVVGGMCVGKTKHERPIVVTPLPSNDECDEDEDEEA